MSRTDRYIQAIINSLEERRASIDAMATECSITVRVKCNAAGIPSVVEFERQERDVLADRTRNLTGALT